MNIITQDLLSKITTVIGVDMDGVKHIVGIWIAKEEDASLWAHVCADHANRGVSDVFIVCCDGLKGLPEAVEATWPGSNGTNLCRTPNKGS